MTLERIEEIDDSTNTGDLIQLAHLIKELTGAELPAHARDSLDDFFEVLMCYLTLRAMTDIDEYIHIEHVFEAYADRAQENMYTLFIEDIEAELGDGTSEMDWWRLDEEDRNEIFSNYLDYQYETNGLNGMTYEIEDMLDVMNLEYTRADKAFMSVPAFQQDIMINARSVITNNAQQKLFRFPLSDVVAI